VAAHWHHICSSPDALFDAVARGNDAVEGTPGASVPAPGGKGSLVFNTRSAIGTAPDAQPEAGAERPSGVRRPFVLCAKHMEQRREWINLQESDEKREEHRRLFRSVAQCPDCQELSWSGQAPPPQPEPQPQAQQPDTYSWWRDVMGQP